MRIAIPVEENKTDICASFGRAPYFLFYDAETGKTEVRENPAARAQGGAGIKAAQFAVDERADAIITIRCGQNAADVLHAANIQIYKADGTNGAENLIACQENRLIQLTHFHTGFQGVQ
jgi:predicted Fe-Mo cluster-binding NifX family protein